MSDSLFSQVQPVRHASQRVVRELGFLQPGFTHAGLPFSAWHALMEIEAGCATQRELTARLRLDKSSTSRIVERLRAEGWIEMKSAGEDKRVSRFALTKAGAKKAKEAHALASARVQSALALLGEEERETVSRGFALYARALERARRREGFTLRPIEKRDERAVAGIIRAVMPEYGAGGQGFAIHDVEVEHMHAAYAAKRTAYFVLTNPEGEVVGGAGVAPLEKGDARTCELRKMYFLPEARGLGFGQELLARCLDAARARGFRRCYLETLERMREARALYERNGFIRLKAAEGCTGHSGCDSWYAREL